MTYLVLFRWSKKKAHQRTGQHVQSVFVAQQHARTHAHTHARTHTRMHACVLLNNGNLAPARKGGRCSHWLLIFSSSPPIFHTGSCDHSEHTTPEEAPRMRMCMVVTVEWSCQPVLQPAALLALVNRHPAEADFVPPTRASVVVLVVDRGLVPAAR